MNYLKQRAEHLEEREHLMMIISDEVYAAKRIECSNETLVGITEEGQLAKTMLAFKSQLICSKFKDVVSLVPVIKLDSTKLPC